jgi:DNA-directed RNA polymerase subunit RPC12/RpoP
MPVLSVKCIGCKKLIPTGFNLDFDGFRELTYVNRKINCPNCHNRQSWNVDDVDRSVFAMHPK